MKTATLFFYMAGKICKNAFLALLTCSFALSAQTIQQKITVTGNVVSSTNGVNLVRNAIDVISLDETRVITTARKTNAYELIAWEVTSSAIIKKATSLVAANVNGIKSAKLSSTRFANAYTRDNKLFLEVWDVSSTGATLTLKAGKTGEDIKSDYLGFALIALSSTRLVSITINTDEKLTFTTWDVASNGTITKAATSIWGVEVRGDLPTIALSSNKFVVEYSVYHGSDQMHMFQVNTAGVISFLDAYGSARYSGSKLAPLTSNRFASFSNTGASGDENSYLLSWNISVSDVLSMNNTPANLVRSNDFSLTKLNSSNVFSAGFVSELGSLILSHGKIANDGTPSKIGEYVSGFSGKQVRATTLLANTTLARVVTGIITTGNTLRLTSWDITIGTPVPRNENDLESVTEEQEPFVAYPNPASADATFSFIMEEDAQASIKIYNALGELMSEVANQNFSKGAHQVSFSVENLASGVYYYSFETAGKQITNKLVIQH